MDVLRQQPEMIAARQHALEHLARLVATADLRQRVDVPEVAGEKRRLGSAEIVGDGVAHDAPVAHQFAPDRFAGAAEPRVFGRQQAEFGEQENAGVEVGRADRAGQRAALFVPRAGEQPFADDLGARRPTPLAFDEAEDARDASEPVARGPAQGGGIGVDPRAAAIFPDAGVGLEGDFPRLLAERLELGEQRVVAHVGQPLVDEHLRRAEHDAAVGIVLDLFRRLIADAHRPVAEIALQRRRGPSPRGW